jgi:hypothetical protein
MSTILQGRFLITTKPFFLKAEHCMGKVAEAPASADSKVCSCCMNSQFDLFRNAIEGDEYQELRACAQPEVGRVRGLDGWINIYLGIIRHLD